jgi:predicted ribosomally synthesized peptide with SipW-like signal peptide
MYYKYLLAGLLLLCAVVTTVVILMMRRSQRQMSGAWKWKLRGVAALAVVVLLGNLGMTAAAFSDREQSVNNTIQVKTGWYNLAWHYRKAITINHTQVSAAAQTNFTVLISRIDPNWANIASGGHAGKSTAEISFSRPRMVRPSSTTKWKNIHRRPVNCSLG